MPQLTPKALKTQPTLLTLPSLPLTRPQDEPLTWLATHCLDLSHPLADAMKQQVGGWWVDGER